MTGSKCCPVCGLAGLLVIVGALSWGAIGVAGMNPLEKLLGSYPTALKIVYIVIGVAGLLKIGSCFKLCPCSRGDGSCSPKK